MKPQKQENNSKNIDNERSLIEKSDMKLADDELSMVSGGAGESGSYIYDDMPFYELNTHDQWLVKDGFCPRCGCDHVTEDRWGYDCIDCCLHIATI